MQTDTQSHTYTHSVIDAPCPHLGYCWHGQLTVVISSHYCRLKFSTPVTVRT